MMSGGEGTIEAVFSILRRKPSGLVDNRARIARPAMRSEFLTTGSKGGKKRLSWTEKLKLKGSFAQKGREAVPRTGKNLKVRRGLSRGKTKAQTPISTIGK